MVGSSFVSDSEIVDHVNQGIAELHDLLVGIFEDYYVESVTFSLPAGNPTTLPDGESNFLISSGPDVYAKGFYKALGVDLQSGGVGYSVKPYMFAERKAYPIGGAGGDLFYRIQGDQIHFIPETPQAGTVTLWYVPEPQYFATGDTAVKLNVKARHIARGYEEYIILDSAIKCLMKEESDVKLLMAQRELVRKRIQEAAVNRQSGEPYRITDVNTGAQQSSYINWKM